LFHAIPSFHFGKLAELPDGNGDFSQQQPAYAFILVNSAAGGQP